MAKSKSSKNWLKEHEDDAWVKRARADGYRSRASYKLLEIQKSDKLIKPGMTVVDLGSAPGGWSQVAATLVGSKGRVIASDILAMEPVPGVDFVQGDFTEKSCLNEILARISHQPPTAAAPGHALRDVHSVEVLDVLSCTPARFSVANPADVAPWNALATDADEKCGPTLIGGRDLLDTRCVDLVISDMAPNLSGMAAMDQPRSMYLVELALDFARITLKPGASLLTKVFQGDGYDSLLKDIRREFAQVLNRKPVASRSRSRELYLLARGYKP